MTLGDAVLYQTVIEKLDDVLHCGKTNCLVILFSGAAGIVGLLAFVIYSFKQSKKDRKKQQALKQNSSGKKSSKSEKKKEEEISKRKVAVKETKPSPRVEKKKEKESPASNAAPKVVHQVPKKVPLNLPSLDQTGETDEWVTVVSRKERKQHQTPREVDGESPDVKVEKIAAPLTKSKESPFVEVVSKPVLPTPVAVIPASLPTVSVSAIHSEKPLKSIANDIKTLPTSDAKPLDAKLLKVQAPVLSKEAPKDVKVSPPVVVSQTAHVVTKPVTVASPPTKVTTSQPASAATSKAVEPKKLPPTPSNASTTAPKIPAEPLDPEWTEINRSAKKRNRVRKDN